MATQPLRHGLSVKHVPEVSSPALGLNPYWRCSASALKNLLLDGFVPEAFAKLCTKLHASTTRIHHFWPRKLGISPILVGGLAGNRERQMVAGLRDL